MSNETPLKVKWIETDPIIKNMTFGKIYDVLSEDYACYFVKNDEGNEDFWSKSIFKIVNEPDEGVTQLQEDVVQNGGSAAHQYRKSVNLPLSGDREEFVDADIEAMDVIDSFDLGFNLGNIVKACLRIGKKEGTDDEYDLNKIIFFALREQKKRSILTHKEFWNKLKAAGLAN